LGDEDGYDDKSTSHLKSCSTVVFK